MSRTSTGSSSLPEPGHAAEPLSVPDQPRSIAAALANLGIRPSRGLGQSFLADPFVADVEAALVGTAPGEPVVEIGGGLGAFTAALLRRGCRPLTVVERDARLAGHLRRTFGERVEVRAGDALTLPLPEARAFAGNLPFAVATPILLRLFEARAPRVVALIQKEVAQRLAAKAGSKSFGRLTIAAAVYGDVELFQVVPRRSFVPVPEVDGQLIVFTGRTGPLPVRSPEVLEETARHLFSARRKQLRNLLPRVTPPTVDPETLAATSEWPADWATLRPEDLPPTAYFALANRIAELTAEPRPPPRRHV